MAFYKQTVQTAEYKDRLNKTREKNDEEEKQVQTKVYVLGFRFTGTPKMPPASIAIFGRLSCDVGEITTKIDVKFGK
ncbi:hypothetical protein L484_004647 [Morus notabilis]|uniref:Uncharacterized protein n=1 Tax=Morus notabilis TaxID=981085 RepID=W9RSW8_9ROSA|nr:hypothetical protein L484_005290 [Morus notabilis]EXB92326.1 hypothetical protein L484_004647 [Morus notabilis]